MRFILGIDSGLTVTKAVIFDETGTAVSTARRRVPQIIPEPRFVERDMDALWVLTAQAIAEAIEAAPCSADDIVAVGATAHGDGLYVLDNQSRPIRNGIVSLDSRAMDLVAEWTKDGTAAKALALTGQSPQPSAPSSLLVWLKRNEPENFAKIASVLSCKDWLRFCLCGVIGTDLTEASTSFTNVASQDFSQAALEVYGLGSLSAAMPLISNPDEVVGQVSDKAAAISGLRQGTPVVAGVHDVTAASLGSGGYGVGKIAVVSGTYSINQTVSNAPKMDDRWLCRNGLVKGEWNSMAVSPASSANYDWFLETMRADETVADNDRLHAQIAQEVSDAYKHPSAVLFHPYLYGSPHGAEASASFLGLRGWHSRGDILRALIEGIAFNHRVHIDALRDGFDAQSIFLTGGISRNPTFAQIFADVFGLDVTVNDVDEASAWGAALCAGSGAGVFETPSDGPSPDQKGTIYVPEPSRAKTLNDLYQLHCEASETLRPLWEKIENLAAGGVK